VMQMSGFVLLFIVFVLQLLSAYPLTQS